MTWPEAVVKALNHFRQYGTKLRVIGDRGMRESADVWWYIVVNDDGDVIFG